VIRLRLALPDHRVQRSFGGALRGRFRTIELGDEEAEGQAAEACGCGQDQVSGALASGAGVHGWASEGASGDEKSGVVGSLGPLDPGATIRRDALLVAEPFQPEFGAKPGKYGSTR
jgi:hypothetical protein